MPETLLHQLFPSISNAKVIKKGIAMYAGVRPYRIWIVESHTRYGTGDYEDPAETAEDQSILCYYIGFESLSKKGVVGSQSGAYQTLDEAVREAETLTNCSVHWVG